MREAENGSPLGWRLARTDWGWCMVAARGASLWRSCLPCDTATRALESLQGRLAPGHQEWAAGLPVGPAASGAEVWPLAPPDAQTAHPGLERAAHLLVAFLGGSPVAPDLPLDLQDHPPFTSAVLAACREIPWGQVVSYGELARRAGSPGASRAVGQVMSRNPLAPFVPCHRVIGSDGDFTGFGGGLELKARLLALEGHQAVAGPAGKWRLGRVRPC